MITEETDGLKEKERKKRETPDQKRKEKHAIYEQIDATPKMKTEKQNGEPPFNRSNR